MHINFLAVIALINFFSALVFGAFVYFKNPKKELNISFGLMNIAIIIWSVGYFLWQISDNEISALFWTRVLSFGSTFISIFYFHWILVLLGLRKKKKKILIFGYILTFVFVFFSFTSLYVKGIQSIFSFKYWPVPGFVYNFYLLFSFFGLVGYSCYLLLQTYSSSSGYKREQIKYVILSSIIGFGGGASNFPLWYGIYFPPYLTLLVILYPIVFTYAIVKYRLMDIRVVIRKSLLYALLVAYVAGAFTFISLLIGRFLHEIAEFNEVLVTLTIALIIVFTIDPLKKFLGRLTDQIFFKAQIDYQEILRKLSKVISYELDLEILLKHFLTIVTKELKVNKAYILLSDKNKSFFQIESYLDGKKAIEFDQKSDLVKYLKKEKKIIISEELERKMVDMDHSRVKTKKELEKVNADLKKFNTSFCVPILMDENLTGILLLGEKLSGDMYTQDDIDLFEIISSQLAAALEKAKLYQETHHFSQKLKVEVEKATEDLRAANETLKELDKTKTEFISITSHQLRTPLSGLKGYLSMLLEGDFGDLDKEKTQVIRDLLNSTEHLVRLVNLFLNVSRVEMGRFTLDKNKTDINVLIEEVIREFAPDIEKKNLAIEFKKASDSELIPIDRDKMKDVILNLLDNAIKYTDKGKIIIETNFKKNLFRFSIQDTGMGIKGENFDILFGKFTRGSNIPVISNKSSSGLGLFIAKKIVEAHGGKIWAESEGEGKGSRFCFEIGMK